MKSFCYFFFTILLCVSTSRQLNGQGLHIINQAPHNVRIQMSTPVQEYVGDLTRRNAYFFSNHPQNMTVYSPNGTCSKFYGIYMNPIFDTLLIRGRNGSPGCVVLGFTGKTRQATPRTIGPVPFEPNYCKARCWNPTSGAIAPQRSNGVITGPMGPLPTTILNAGTDDVEPNPVRT